MKTFKYAGKYINEESLPKREHPEGYVPYKEPESMKKLAIVVNVIAIVIMFIVFPIYFLRALVQPSVVIEDVLFKFVIGTVLQLLTLVPHEFIHGLALKGDVKMYQNLKQGLMFVISTDDMSKKEFIFMSLLPNIVFGFIPFVIFLLFPKLLILGSLGATSIAAGAGDYMNVFNTIVQVPKNAKVYMSGLHSYWYL